MARPFLVRAALQAARWPIRMLVLTVFAAASAASAEAASFVYATVPAPACAAGAACNPPQLIVIDADTGGIVKRLALPPNTQTWGMTISRDNSRIYVSNRDATNVAAPASVTVVDAQRHAILTTFSTGTDVFGPLAVRGDGSRLFVLTSTATGGRIVAFDTTTFTVAGTSEATLPSFDIEVSAALDQLIVFGPQSNGYSIGKYDAATLDHVGTTNLPSNRTPFGMSLSRDQHRLHVVMDIPQFFNPTTARGVRLVFDPLTLAMTSSFEIPPNTQAGAGVESTRTNELLAVGQNLAVLRRFSLTSTAMTSVSLPGDGLDITVPPGDTKAFVGTRPHQSLGGVNGVAAIDLNSGAVVHTTRLDRAPGHIISTPADAQTCSYRVDGGFRSFAVAGGTSAVRLTTTCDWDAGSGDSWVRVSTSQGSGNAAIDITVDPHVLPTPRTATLTIGGQLVTVTQAGGVSQPPFGVLDTPVNGVVGLSGAVGITGWALDDVGVSRVRVFRDPVGGEGASMIYVGDATLVEGARPDVQAFFPTLPFANRAGWGLNVLTNMLPNGGNGTYRFWAFADDVDGQTALVGTTSFTTSNTASLLPFGAIDTPGQGETVSGTIVNWGWALTPHPAGIPVDGSTIDVLIDGVVVGRPTYGLFRSDVAALFPGYANTNSAVGYFTIDTRMLASGLHTIAWVVRDSAGNAQGIGSRYFTVFND